MEITIKTYDASYLDAQVELGNLVMNDWKYQTQSSKEHLQKVYSRSDFQDDTRLYAFDNNQKLVGFQTSHVLIDDEENKIGRMEFPIVLNDQWEVAKKLQEESEQTLIDKGVILARVRVSEHWGRTTEYAEKFGFIYETPSVSTSRSKIDNIKHIDTSAYKFLSVDPSEEGSSSTFKEIFPKRFPMRYDGEVDEWMKYYADKDPVIWLVQSNDEGPCGHTIGFAQNESVNLTSIFTLGESSGTKLQALLSHVALKLTAMDFTEINLTIGDPQVPFIPMLEEIGFNFEHQISYFTKNFDGFVE